MQRGGATEAAQGREATRPTVALSGYWARFAIASTFAAFGGCYQGVDVGVGTLSAAEDGANSGGDGASGSTDGDGGGDDDGDDPAAGEAPGATVLHRLNNTEYDNTIRDLFWGLPVTPSEGLPDGARDNGYLNMAEVLTLSDVSLQLYEQTTDSVLATLFEDAGRMGQLLDCDAQDLDLPCVESTIERFAPRAWRRPLTDAELAERVEFSDAAFDDAKDAHATLRQSLKAVLLSPYFLFRVEIDPDPESTEPHLLNDYELASRLSYFLWSSMPDDGLFDAAATGELVEEDTLLEQVDRMLSAPRSEALLDSYAEQWLHYERLGLGLVKDLRQFPDFNDDVSASLYASLRARIRSLFFEQRDLRELLTSKTAFIDDRIASLYGAEPPPGGEMVEVEISETPRKGLLTDVAMMAALANDAEAATVERGLWVLDRLLCIRPADPAGIDIPDLPPPAEGSTMRDELSRHRQNPMCAACHSLIDPVGLALETYDAVGAYRETYENGAVIITADTLVTGESFEDAIELAGILAADDEFSVCAAQNLMSYALGRSVATAEDREYVSDVVSQTSESFDFTSIVRAVITSPAFRMRQGGN